MKLFKRADRVLAKHDAIEADIRRRDRVQPSFASQFRHVRTEQGRKAHLEDPERPGSGALCEWPGALVAADPALPVCQLCKVAAGLADERRAS